MCPTPAATGANVRTIGTKRAAMIANGPKRSKNLLVRMTLSLEKNPLSLRSKMRGPALWPMR
jgi:hypothetical protein